VIASSANKLDAAYQNDFSGLIAAWGNGDEQALNHLIPLVYPDLRRIARQHLFRNPNHTLQSAALVNEAYLRLIQARGIQCQSRPHFFALCAMTIRRILVDHARTRQYQKRGSNVVMVPLEEALLGTRGRGADVLALDDALSALSKVDHRKGRVVELRFFGGLSVDETAVVLGISPETVMRDWKMAKTWLLRELSKGSYAKSAGKSDTSC
jgi:RNA polymerase sigma-70 factor, ECF subfamily